MMAYEDDDGWQDDEWDDDPGWADHDTDLECCQKCGSDQDVSSFFGVMLCSTCQARLIIWDVFFR